MSRDKSFLGELIELFIAFFKIGLFTIGGGIAMIPLMQRVAVKEKGWLTDEEMIDCIAVCNSVPGVVAINAATFIGNKRKGLKGAVFATLGVIFPSFIIIMIIVLFINQIRGNIYVEGLFVGLKAAACGLVAIAVYTVGRQTLKNFFGWIVAIGSFVAIEGFNISMIIVLPVAAVLGLVFYGINRRKKGGRDDIIG